LWKRPITLRSKRVKKATERRIRRHWTSQEITMVGRIKLGLRRIE